MVSTGLSFRKASGQISLMIVLFFFGGSLARGLCLGPLKKRHFDCFSPAGQRKATPSLCVRSPLLWRTLQPPFCLADTRAELGVAAQRKKVKKEGRYLLALREKIRVNTLLSVKKKGLHSIGGSRRADNLCL